MFYDSNYNVFVLTSLCHFVRLFASYFISKFKYFSRYFVFKSCQNIFVLQSGGLYFTLIKLDLPAVLYILNKVRGIREDIQYELDGGTHILYASSIRILAVGV
jgi:hypothetical protein